MPRNAISYLLLFLLLGGAWTGCAGCLGSDDEMEDPDELAEEAPDPREAPTSIEEAMNQAQEAMNEAFSGDGPVVREAVDFRELRDMLPDDVAGLNRVNAEGERVNVAGGIRFSQAEGTYEDGEEWLKITYLDLGTVAGIARMAYTQWLQYEVDRESDSGFERTGKFSVGGQEYPSFEKFEVTDGDRGECEVMIWVAERFMVQVEGRNVEMEQCEEARDEVPFRQIDRMKTVGTDAE